MEEWLQISIKTAREGAEAVAEILREAGAFNGVQIDDPLLAKEAGDETAREDENVLYISAFYPEDGKMDERIEYINKALSAVEERIGAFQQGNPMFRHVSEKDWSEQWKQYFHVTKVGENIVIKPSWEEYEEKNGDVVLELDPGMAFGTGTHPTSCMCLEYLEELVNPEDTVFDVGCGSGILSMIAAKLGAHSVKAVDIDTRAVAAAEENIKAAGMEDVVEVRCGDLLHGTEGQADIIVANILADIIVMLLPDVAGKLKDDGLFITSGIIKEALPMVEKAAEECSLQVIDKKNMGEWMALLMKKKTEENPDGTSEEALKKTKKAAFHTLGCKVNQSDTAAMEALFKEAGYEVVGLKDEADVYLINTCVVTNVAQQKSRQMLRRTVRKHPDSILIVAGCYPQTAPEEVAAIKGVDLMLGNSDRHRVVEMAEEALAEKRGWTLKKKGEEIRNCNILDYVEAWEKGEPFELLAGGNTSEKTRAYLKVQEGCNQYCTYCIIPYARGPLRSRPLEDIKNETARLVQEGYKEVTLLGIHLGCFGKESGGKISLRDAVEAALSGEGPERLRLGSLESVEVDKGIPEIMLKDSRLAHHLHLPLQSGSNKILKAMNRPYTSERYEELIADIRNKVQDIAITTDIIVGFPGETEEDFQDTMDFAARCGFAKIHIFPYSMRKGTPAAKLPQVNGRIKQERVARLSELDEKLQAEFIAGRKGSVVKVLVEQEIDLNEEERMAAEKCYGLSDLGELREGLSGNYMRVVLPCDGSAEGEFREVEIIGSCKGLAFGRKVK